MDNVWLKHGGNIMAEKVKVVVFKNEAEAYKKFSDIKNGLREEKDYVLSEMALVKKTSDQLEIRESLDTGVETSNDTSTGFFIGSLVGILGGPIGILLGSATGALSGSIVDSFDASENASIIQKVSETITDGETAIIALIGELGEDSFDAEFSECVTQILSEDAAEVMAEIDAAYKVELELKKEAAKKLIEEKKTNLKQKIEEFRKAIKAKFDKKR